MLKKIEISRNKDLVGRNIKKHITLVSSGIIQKNSNSDLRNKFVPTK